MQSTTATQKAIDIIAQGRKAWDRSMLQRLIAAAQNAKAPGYDAHQRKIRTYYESHQAQSVRAALKKRYPMTAEKMSVLPLNIVGTTADLDAQAYRHAPERWAETVAGERDDDSDNAKRFLREC